MVSKCSRSPYVTDTRLMHQGGIDKPCLVHIISSSNTTIRSSGMIPFISEAHFSRRNNAAVMAEGAGMVGQLIMLGGFVLIFWLLIWRPQNKRAKSTKTF